MTSKEWKTYKLSDFMEFNPRETLAKGTIAKKIAMENLQPFCRDVCQYEFAPYNGGVKFKNGDTIMARITPCLENGKTSKVNILEDNEIAFGSTEYIVFRKRDNISDENFIYYLVASPKIREIAIKSMVGSSGRQRVQADVLADLELELPPLETQEKIARILSSLDDKIELNNKINQNLEQQAQAIFKSWFVDFEPFGGKIPEDWTIGALKDVIDFYNGYAFKSKNLLNEPNQNSFAVFKQGHINRGGGFNISGTKSWIDKSNIKDLNKYILQKGDVLMAMTDMKDNVAILGNTAIMPFNNQYIVNQRVGLLRCNNDFDIKYPYVYIMTNSEPFLSNLRKGANSGVQVNLSSEQIKNSEIIIPSKNINQQYNKLTIPMFEIIFKNYTENKQLTQLRDTLLPKLMSGEIDVDKVEV